MISLLKETPRLARSLIRSFAQLLISSISTGNVVDNYFHTYVIIIFHTSIFK